MTNEQQTGPVPVAFCDDWSIFINDPLNSWPINDPSGNPRMVPGVAGFESVRIE